MPENSPTTPQAHYESYKRYIRKLRKRRKLWELRRRVKARAVRAHQPDLSVNATEAPLAAIDACRAFSKGLDLRYRRGGQELVANTYLATLRLRENERDLAAFLSSSFILSYLGREPTQKDRANLPLLVAVYVVDPKTESARKRASKMGRAITALFKRETPAEEAVATVTAFGMDKLAREVSKKRPAEGASSTEADPTPPEPPSANPTCDSEPETLRTETSKKAPVDTTSASAAPHMARVPVSVEASPDLSQQLLDAPAGDTLFVTGLVCGSRANRRIRLIKVDALRSLMSKAGPAASPQIPHTGEGGDTAEGDDAHQ